MNEKTNRMKVKGLQKWVSILKNLGDASPKQLSEELTHKQLAEKRCRLTEELYLEETVLRVLGGPGWLAEERCRNRGRSHDLPVTITKCFKIHQNSASWKAKRSP